MKLEDRIMADLKEAMKAKDKARMRGIRAVKQALLLAKTDGSGKELSAEDEIKLVQKLVKQRKDSIKVYEEQSRADLAEVEQEEIDVLQNYLPEQMSEEDLTAFLKNLVGEVNAEGMKDMGRVMGLASKQLAGKAEGQLISKIVKSILMQ